MAIEYKLHPAIAKYLHLLKVIFDVKYPTTLNFKYVSQTARAPDEANWREISTARVFDQIETPFMTVSEESP